MTSWEWLMRESNDEYCDVFKNFDNLSSGGEEWFRVALRTPFADTVMQNMYASGMLGLMSKQNLQNAFLQRISNKQLGRKYVIELIIKMLKKCFQKHL